MKYFKIISFSIVLILSSFLISCSNNEILDNNKDIDFSENINIDKNEDIENEEENNSNKTNINNNNLEEERLKKEQELKEEEEKKKPINGVNSNGEEYSYDANVIWERLQNYNYSNNGEKIVFLTFDDGPSTTVTPKVLDILNKNNVKGTFFITGQQLEKPQSQELLKEIFEGGHAIGNHTYSHNYSYLYPNRSLNLENFKTDINKTNSKLKEILGDNFNTRVIRCPGGYMSWDNMSPLKDYFYSNNLVSMDWNALIKDAEGKKKTPSELLDFAISTSANKDIVVLLMHDTYGKENTAEALQGIIDYYKNQGYSFKTLK